MIPQLEANLRELEANMQHITEQYQEWVKALAETLVGDAVRKIAAEGQEIQDGMRYLLQQEQTDIRRLVGTIKSEAGVVSAALIIAVITTTFFNDIMCWPPHGPVIV